MDCRHQRHQRYTKCISHICPSSISSFIHNYPLLDEECRSAPSMNHTSNSYSGNNGVKYFLLQKLSYRWRCPCFIIYFIKISGYIKTSPFAKIITMLVNYNVYMFTSITPIVYFFL